MSENVNDLVGQLKEIDNLAENKQKKSLATFTHGLLPAKLKKYLKDADPDEIKIYEDAYQNWKLICKQRNLVPFGAETAALAPLYIDQYKDYVVAMTELNKNGAIIMAKKHTPQGEIYETPMANPALKNKSFILKSISILIGKLDSLSKLVNGGGHGGMGNKNATKKIETSDDFIDVLDKTS